MKTRNPDGESSEQSRRDRSKAIKLVAPTEPAHTMRKPAHELGCPIQTYPGRTTSFWSSFSLSFRIFARSSGKVREGGRGPRSERRGKQEREACCRSQRSETAIAGGKDAREARHLLCAFKGFLLGIIGIGH